MVISRQQLEEQLRPGLNHISGLNYKEIAGEHKYLFAVENSVRAFEEEVHMTAFGEAVEKPEGEGITYDDAREAWKSRYTHKTMGLAFSITQEAVEDNLYESQSKLKAKGLGRSMASAKEQKAADVFNNGFNASFAGGDGKPLFAADHPTLVGDFDNLETAQLSETAVEDATINISLFEDDRGILMGAQAEYIVVPPQLKYTICKILKSNLSTNIATGADSNGVTNRNDINVVNSDNILPQGSYCNHRLTSDSAWFIKTSAAEGTKMFQRRKLTGSMDGDFDTDNVRYKNTERYSFGWTDPRGWLGSTGAA